MLGKQLRKIQWAQLCVSGNCIIASRIWLLWEKEWFKHWRGLFDFSLALLLLLILHSVNKIVERFDGVGYELIVCFVREFLFQLVNVTVQPHGRLLLEVA